MNQPWLRILLATYLAIWSPAMCCCDVKLAIGRVTGMQARACGSAVLTPADVPPMEAAPEHSCCAQRTAKGPVEPVLQGCARPSPVSDDHGNRCRCHETGDSKIRLDTGSKIVVSDLVRSDLTIPSLVSPIMAALPVDWITTGLMHGPWPPGKVEGIRLTMLRQQTLLGRGCMLLI